MKQFLMTSQIMKSADFTKTQKSRYLENEQNVFLKKSAIIHQGPLYCKNSFIAELTFNTKNRELNFKKHPLNTMPCLPFSYL